MRRIRWAPAAAADLEFIRNYLREHHPALTVSTVRKLYAAVLSLKKFPFRGRLGHKQSTRELVTAPLPYIIVYGIESDLVHIYRIVHGAEDRQ